MSGHYEPFTDEWKKEMMKMRKENIIDAFAVVAQEKQELEKSLRQ
jgi:hypothetical protein